MPPKADVRRLLKKQQTERTKTQRITHPFAKYNETGRLICIVCNSPVKNEAVWQAHLGSSVHRDNIQKLKALKQQQQQQQQESLKRRAPSPSPPPTTNNDTNKRTRMEQNTQDIELDEQVEDSSEDEEMALPADFFDAGNKDDDDEEIQEVEEEEEEEEEEVEEEETEGGGGGGGRALPTGFFDDPEEEARIQGTLAPEDQAAADLEKDIEMFNEAMIDVTKEAKQVQEEDDETFWIERHGDISREQAMFDSRVEKLKYMRQTGQVVAENIKETEQDDVDDVVVGLKTSVRQLLKSKPTKQVQSMFDEDEEEEESEEEEDWRAQQL